MFNSDGKKTAVERDKWKTVIEWRRKKKCQNQWNLWTLENIFLSRQQAPDGIFSEPLIFTASLAMEFVWKSNYFVKLFPKSFATNFQNDCNHEIAPTFATFSESNLTLNEPPRDHKWNEKSQSNNIHKFTVGETIWQTSHEKKLFAVLSLPPIICFMPRDHT